jgi:hypothetical protein
LAERRRVTRLATGKLADWQSGKEIIDVIAGHRGSEARQSGVGKATSTMNHAALYGVEDRTRFVYAATAFAVCPREGLGATIPWGN